MPALVVSSLALTVIGAVTIYTLPEPHIALPKFSSFAELFPRETVSVPIPDPAVIATLKEMQSAQLRNEAALQSLKDIHWAQERHAAALQENGAALQQNTGMLRQSAATLESLRQGFTAQQTNLKTVSNQLSLLLARVDSLENAVKPLTTSSIPQPNARARLAKTSRKKTARLPTKPVGPVSTGGAPLRPAPATGSDAG